MSRVFIWGCPGISTCGKRGKKECQAAGRVKLGCRPEKHLGHLEGALEEIALQRCPGWTGSHTPRPSVLHGPAWTRRDLGEGAVRPVRSSGWAGKSPGREGSWPRIHQCPPQPSFTAHFRSPDSQPGEEHHAEAFLYRSLSVLQFAYFVHPRGTENTRRVEEEGLCARGRPVR